LTLLEQIMEAGLLQFGLFQRGSSHTPLQTAFEMLASYPGLLRDITGEGHRMIGEQHFDHLLCTHDAVPFGVALSLATGIPLVYSRGRGEAPVHDLVGAYDIGHPALLVANVWDDGAERLAAAGRRVGLEVRAGLAVLDIGTQPHNLIFTALLRLPDVLETLVASGQLPQGQADVVKSWANL
jgi:hypothetical protein